MLLLTSTSVLTSFSKRAMSFSKEGFMSWMMVCVAASSCSSTTTPYRVRST